MQYHVVTAIDVSQLETTVEAAIADGWIPIGGVAIIDNVPQSVLAQAMTKG